MALRNTLKCAAVAGALAASVNSGQAASCRLQSFAHLCWGCTIELDWKIRRKNKQDSIRWCRFSFATGVSYRKGFTVVDGFSLGEMLTGYDNVRISGLKLGRDRVTVQLNGITNLGKPYTSTIHFNVEVVEGEF